MLPRDRQKRPARNRLDHDIEAVLGTSQERQDKRKHSGSAVPNNMDLNYMSEGEDDHAMKELQRMAESAAILGETHDLDDTSSYSTSSGSSASYSSSYSSQSEDETEVYVSRAAKGRNEPKPKGVHRENVHWASARAPVSSLAVLTAGEFGQVNRGLRELTHMEDSETEVTDRNEQFAQNDRDEKFSQNAHSGLEDKSSQRQDCIVERTENEHREIESDSFIQSSHSSPFARPSDTRPQGPPAYEIADTYSRIQGDSTSSTGGQHSSDYSPSHGSYVLNSIPSERQSPASQVLFGLEGDVFDEKPFLTAKTDTPEDPAEDEVRRSVSPVPLKRSMGVSALEGSDVGEHVTVFSRSSRASTLRSDQSEESPERKARTLLQERVTSHTEDNGHDTGTQSEKGDAEHEKKKKKKKKKKKRRKKRKDDQRDGSEKQPAEPEVSSSQEVEGQETIPLRSIMHPYPNPTNISHHVHWPDDEEL
nr:hypothetical protein BaRGS_024716 [Batillaria attramentaria]